MNEKERGHSANLKHQNANAGNVANLQSDRSAGENLRELYQDVILDHNQHPRNFKKPAEANRTIEGYNPLCGDHFTLYVRMDNDVIADIGFEGSGCAISKSSASIMTTMVKGKTKAEAEEVFEKFHHMVTRPSGEAFDVETVGKLAVFAQVCEYPARVKCASLAWHTLKAALDGKNDPVSTE